MTKYVVIVNEVRYITIEAESPEHIRRMFDEAGSLEDQGGEMFEMHDNIVSIEAE